MNTDSLFARWDESLDLFKKSNLKLFCLGVLNNWIRAIKTFGLRFIALYALWVMLACASLTLFTSFNLLFFILPVVTFLVRGLIVYIMVMTTRASLEQKNYRYYIKYLPFAWVAIGVNLFIDSWIFLPVLILILLFFLDSQNSIMSLLVAWMRTLKTTLSFLPAISILTFVIGLLSLVQSFPFNFIADSSSFMQLISLMLVLLLQDMLFLLMISIITVYYIKVKHAHFTLLFE